MILVEPLELLAAGVPLTLLMDLARPSGPASHRLLADEPADLAWLQAASTLEQRRQSCGG